jgi:hypothetical protein
MMIYTFVVFGGGVVVGLAALWVHGDLNGRHSAS